MAKLRNDPKHNNIVLKNTTGPLAEVVVTGYSIKKRKDITGSVSTIKDESTIEPIDGWANFYNYTKTEIQRFKDSTANAFNGDVDVEFSITKKGRPKNITISPKTDKAIIEKAKQILQKGPLWKGKKGAKGKVKLHF